MDWQLAFVIGNILIYKIDHTEERKLARNKHNEIEWNALSYSFLFVKPPHLQCVQGRITSLQNMRTKGYQLINNGNRTEWSLIRPVIIRVINKIGWPRSGSPIRQSRVWLQTELDDTKSCYQLIITIAISENNKYV